MSALSVVCCDRYRAFAEALSEHLSANGFELAGIAADPEACLELIETRKVDVVITEVQFAARSGLEMLDRVHIVNPSASVIVLSSCDVAFLERCLGAGADAVCLKSDSLEEVEKIIRLVCSEEFRSSSQGGGGRPKVWSRRARASQWKSLTLTAPLALTTREEEVLKLLGRGSTTTAIAETMHISAVTVRTHLQNLFNKLGVHSRLELLSKAVRVGLIQPCAFDPTYNAESLDPLASVVETGT